MFDSTGINLSGEVGHRIELALNDNPFYVFDLTDDFNYYPGSYQRGEVLITLPEVEDGNYTFFTSHIDRSYSYHFWSLQNR